MPMTKMADLHDLVAAERFLAAEARIAGTFGRIEEAVAPLLRGYGRGTAPPVSSMPSAARSSATPSCGRPTRRAPRRSGSSPLNSLRPPPDAPPHPLSSVFSSYRLRCPAWARLESADPPCFAVGAIVASGARARRACGARPGLERSSRRPVTQQARDARRRVPQDLVSLRSGHSAATGAGHRWCARRWQGGVGPEPHLALVVKIEAIEGELVREAAARGDPRTTTARSPRGQTGSS